MIRASTLATAQAAWGDPLPDWIEALARACDARSQASVAAQLDYSKTAVSLLVNGRYDRDLGAIERRVREILMVLICPVLGEIDGDICRDHQAAPWAATNHLRVSLYRACRAGCPNSKLEGAQ